MQLVLRTRDEEAVASAVSSMDDAGRRAQRLVDRIESLRPVRLVYEYDPSENRWSARHLTTEARGVFSNRPELIVLESATGFSVGGSYGDEWDPM